MRRPRLSILLIPATAVVSLCTHPGLAAGRVELELVTGPGVPITAQQDWLRRLSEAGVANLRIRGMRSGDRAGISVRGTERSPSYIVTGVVTSGGDVLLPGARFRSTEAAGIARWLDDLARYGPPEGRSRESAFGLRPRQFEQVHKDLSQQVGLSTEGLKRREAIERIAKRLATPVRVEPRLLQSIPDDDVVGEELSGLSCGTALAYAVRPLGGCLVPRDAGAAGLECAVVQAKPDIEAWPIGWEPEKRPGEILHGLFEFFNANVQGVTIVRVLDAVRDRLKVPILMDHNALARHGVEPQKSYVNLPASRTSYSLLLRRALYQAGLKYELRVDEAGKPFLWVTTLKPI
jgi:hypothetical protein